MSDLLDIKLIIDKGWPKLTVIIKNNEQNEDVEAVIAAVQGFVNKKIPMIPAYYKGSLVMLPQRQIIRLYVLNRKVMVQTSEKVYEFKKSLKDIEDLLDTERFVRISQSEIINLRKVKSFDFSASGTIGVFLENDERTYVARRRVHLVKDALSHTGQGTIGGNKNEH